MPDPRVLSDGHAPTPFTAAEIRDNCPPGRTVTSEVVDESGASARINRFLECDADGAVFTSNETAHRVTWVDLQRHASFPASVTEITTEHIETPLGRLECLRYRVENGSEVETFWFDVGRPGLPVRYTTEIGGRLISATTMVSDSIVPPDDPA